MSGEADAIDDLDAGGEPDAAVAAAATAAADAGGADADPDEDGDLAVEVQHGGEKVRMVPVSTLVSNRKASRDRVAAAEAKAADLEAKLTKVNGDVEKLAPILRAMQGRPDLVEHAMKGTRPSATDHPANDAADPEMVELAKSMDLYDADGKPDAARAARISATFEKKADAKADAKVKPIIDAQVQQRADANKAHLYRWAEGGHVSKAGVDKAIAMLPGAEQLLAHDGVRDVIYFMAKGMSPAAAKAAAGTGAADVVIHTEAAGGRGKATVDLPNFSKQNAARRGKSTTEWSKIRDVDSDVLE